MIDYLEELDMAYREDLSTRDLIACGDLFRSASTPRGWQQMASRGVFEAAHGVTGLMDDLHADFLARHQRFSVAPYRNGATFYAKHFEDGWESANHHLGWSITRQNWRVWQVVCSICWDDLRRQPRFWLCLQGTTVGKPLEEEPPIARFFRNGKLDRAKLLNFLESRLTDWGVLKKRTKLRLK